MPLGRIKQVSLSTHYASGGTKVPTITMVSQVGVIESATAPVQIIENTKKNENARKVIEKKIVGVSVHDFVDLDNSLRGIRADRGMVLAVSMAASRLSAKVSHRTLYQQLRDECLFVGHGWRRPSLVVTLLESEHQRLVAVIPAESKKNNLKQQLDTAIGVYSTLGKSAETVRSSGAGKCGGYRVPSVMNVRLWQLVKRAVEKTTSQKIVLGLDMNADEYYASDSGRYKIDNESALDRVELMAWLKMLGRQYNMKFLIDVFSSKDWLNSGEIVTNLNNGQVFVNMRDIEGDHKKLSLAHHKNDLDVVGIRLGDYKTVGDALGFTMQAKHYSMRRMCSLSSVETEDSFVVDLALATGVEFLDLGGGLGNEHMSKYNRLLTIAEQENI